MFWYRPLSKTGLFLRKKALKHSEEYFVSGCFKQNEVPENSARACMCVCVGGFFFVFFLGGRGGGGVGLGFFDTFNFESLQFQGAKFPDPHLYLIYRAISLILSCIVTYLALPLIYS